ncbi:hypothetical protein ABTL54_20915, partial [Acinetobacter baumannii]
ARCGLGASVLCGTQSELARTETSALPITALGQSVVLPDLSGDAGSIQGTSSHHHGTALEVDSQCHPGRPP